MNPSDVGNQDRHIVQEVIKVRLLTCLKSHLGIVLLYVAKELGENLASYKSMTPHKMAEGMEVAEGTRHLLNYVSKSGCPHHAGHVQESAIGYEGFSQL